MRTIARTTRLDSKNRASGRARLEELIDYMVSVAGHIQKRILRKHKLTEADRFSAMQAVCRAWLGDGVILVDLGKDSAVLGRLQGWAARKNCSISRAAQGGLAKFPRDVFPTAEEDAAFEVAYAGAVAHQKAAEGG